MNLNECLAKVKEAEKEISDAHEMSEAWRKKVVEMFAPLEVGVVVDVPEAAYVHQGKKCRITNIVLEGRGKKWDEFEFLFLGLVLLKSGETGTSKAEWRVEL